MLRRRTREPVEAPPTPRPTIYGGAPRPWRPLASNLPGSNNEAMRPAPVPATVALLIEAGESDRPHGSHGEMLPSPPPTPPAQLGQTFVIEPPDWESELAARPPDPPSDPTDTIGALASMRIEAGDLDDLPEFVLPLTLPRLERPKPPAPDWSRESTERSEQHLAELQAKSLQSRPA